jgi:DNA polymerase
MGQMTSEEKKKALLELAKELEKTQGGPLKGPGVNAVFGEGDPEAKVLFIGEAPGFNENQQQRPFVGISGKLLRKNILANGWKENEVYITNIVKFRPPENRDPLPSEIEFFRTFLDRQIEIIAPEIIVTLGRFSMYKFFGEAVSISHIHGMPRKIDWNGRSVTIFPMYHPAAALRQGSVLRDFERDFVKLREMTIGPKVRLQPEVVKITEPAEKQLGLI